MTTTQNVHDVRITVSEPYHVVGFHGGRYGASAGTKRDYAATVMGRDFRNTSKAAIREAITRAIRREEIRAGFLRLPIRFTFVPEQEV